MEEFQWRAWWKLPKRVYEYGQRGAIEGRKGRMYQYGQWEGDAANVRERNSTVEVPVHAHSPPLEQHNPEVR